MISPAFEGIGVACMSVSNKVRNSPHLFTSCQCRLIRANHAVIASDTEPSPHISRSVLSPASVGEG